MWWTGPDSRYPGAALWSTDPEKAATYRSEVEAVDAFAALSNPGYRLPVLQLQIADAAGPRDEEPR
jgi:hypothetical protein